MISNWKLQSWVTSKQQENIFFSTILNFSSHEAFEAKQEKKWVGSCVWMQSKCISVKGINVYLDKRKKNMSFKIPYKFERKLYGKLCKKRKKKKEDIGILHDKQAFTIFLHSPEKHDILYCNLASTVKGNMFYSG